MEHGEWIIIIFSRKLQNMKNWWKTITLSDKNDELNQFFEYLNNFHHLKKSEKILRGVKYIQKYKKNIFFLSHP